MSRDECSLKIDIDFKTFVDVKLLFILILLPLSIITLTRDANFCGDSPQTSRSKPLNQKKAHRHKCAEKCSRGSLVPGPSGTLMHAGTTSPS